VQFNEQPVTQDVVMGKLLAGILFPQTDTHVRYDEEVALMQAIMETLEPHLPPYARGWKYSFQVLPTTDRVDAKSLPGGQIFVTLGTFLESPRVDLLAAILTHEVGHVGMRHGTLFETIQQRNLEKLNAAIRERALATTPEEKKLREQNVTSALVTHWDTTSVLVAHEVEADVFAAHVASEAGYDLEVLAQFHERQAFILDTSEDARVHPARSVRARVLRCFPGKAVAQHEHLNALLHAIQERHRKPAR